MCVSNAYSNSYISVCTQRPEELSDPQGLSCVPLGVMGSLEELQVLLTTLFSLSSPKPNCLRIVWFMGGDVTQGGKVIFFLAYTKAWV